MATAVIASAVAHCVIIGLYKSTCSQAPTDSLLVLNDWELENWILGNRLALGCSV